jgi:1-acyl-sn-glycerol-3-phosphate acyltransferase
LNDTGPSDLRLRSRFAWSVLAPAIKPFARMAWRLAVDGRWGFPSPPFVLAANHHSFLDPLLIGAAYGGRVRFIGLAELFGRQMILDWLMDSFEVITVRRGTVPLSAMRRCLTHLADGGVVALFPEGTRVTRFGEGKLYPGAAWLAVRAGVPLVAVAVVGTDLVLGVDNKLRRGRVRVVVGPALHPSGEGRAAVDELTRRWRDWIATVV